MTTIRELSKLKDWQIRELNVDENPLCTDYTARERYIRLTVCSMMRSAPRTSPPSPLASTLNCARSVGDCCGEGLKLTRLVRSLGRNRRFAATYTPYFRA